MDYFILITMIISLILITYHHIGYPVLLKVISKRSELKDGICTKGETQEGEERRDSYLRSITLVIPAYNEAEYIAEKISNISWLDYPNDRFKVIIACDGCTDATPQIASQAANIARANGLNIEVRIFEKNRGKCAVINDIMSTVSTQLVAFSDVSALISIDALEKCSQHFEDQAVGSVTGNYIVSNASDSGKSEQLYWQYQKQIKLGEQALGSLVGAHGAFYMLRTRLYFPLKEDTVNDDFIIPMQAAQLGGRIVYEQCLNAIELEPSDNKQNWKRRKRIGFGNAQQAYQLRGLLNPRHKGLALAFFSSKVLRVYAPFLMIFCLFASAYCAFIWPLISMLFMAQLLVYLCAIVVEVTGKDFGKIPSAIHYLVTGHLANMIGALNYFTRRNYNW